MESKGSYVYVNFCKFDESHVILLYVYETPQSGLYFHLL